jgi:hypothetical protein
MRVMGLPQIGFRPLVILAAFLAGASTASVVSAQQGNTAGVFVDADGVLHKREFDPTGQLNRQRINAARQGMDPRLTARSPLRKVSLNRLEKAIEAQLAESRPTEEMLCLAGLTRVQYVFFYPETNDIVIAGPAEGWFTDASGRVRGLSTGQPIIELQDLVVALRAFPPGGKEGPMIGCSIDPTQEGLARYQEFLRRVGGTATPRDTQAIVNGLRNSLGLQTITVHGVAPSTHFAQVMIEADYRMKLIGIGLEKPPVKLASYVDLASPSQVGRNALQRWYFVPDYQCVRVSDDELAMELVGEGVKLVGEDEVVTHDGTRQQAATSNRASQTFVHAFTKVYPELSAKSPVYAQLRNLIDMAIAAAFIQAQDFYGHAGWTMATFGREERLPVETNPTPQKVDTVVTSIWRGNRLMTPLGGGVEIRAHEAIATGNRLADEGGKVEQARREIRIELADGQWWWD